MGKNITVAEQASELCMQIHQAVECWWLYESLANYLVVERNKKRAEAYLHACTAIWNAAFDSVIVSAYNLVVTQKNGNPLTFSTFADELDAAGHAPKLVIRLRAFAGKHSDFIGSVTRIRNKTTAHVDRSLTTERQFNSAKLSTADTRIFLQDLIYLFHAIEPFASRRIRAPAVEVRYEMSQMLHLAIRSSEQMRALARESTGD